jgi:hypothetical protein
MAYFTQSKTAPQLEFRRQLAKELIDYSYKAAGIDRRKNKRSEAAMASGCGVETAPHFAGNWNGDDWEVLTIRYPQHVCRALNCKKGSELITNAWLVIGCAQHALEYILHQIVTTNEFAT